MDLTEQSIFVRIDAVKWVREQVILRKPLFKVLSEVKVCLKGHGCGDLFDKFYVVLEEYVTNLKKYADSSAFSLLLGTYKGELFFCLCDRGCAFNPFQACETSFGVRMLTGLFPCRYRRLYGMNCLRFLLK